MLEDAVTLPASHISLGDVSWIVELVPRISGIGVAPTTLNRTPAITALPDSIHSHVPPMASIELEAPGALRIPPSRLRTARSALRFSLEPVP